MPDTSRKCARNYRKYQSEQMSHRQEFNNPKKTSFEEMRELCLCRKLNEKTADRKVRHHDLCDSCLQITWQHKYRDITFTRESESI
ncbi:hypothetical protein AVEN_37210-1 [Araneus ventricosus]|uniref:Uncharacterized protein n=1 Tax=Araneus ventricosus TaxID=182803 RepID=A0A4Y2SZ54_ARAVE|nr:hypothetical protein AVEN_37210-1 [Araneus ventricosus]